jgi:hypothetical protein
VKTPGAASSAARSSASRNGYAAVALSDARNEQVRSATDNP